MPEERLTITVIIPTYNRASLLPNAIDSLLKQTRIPDEILIVDDGSTDNTQEVLARYGPPVRIITQPNQGPSAARNVGLRNARGDLIAFLDSDDTLLPDSIMVRADALKTHADFDAVYADAYLIDTQGQVIGRFSQRRRGARPSGNIFPEFAYHNIAPIHTIMFRRSCLEKTGYFDESLFILEDYDFWLRMTAHYRFFYIDTPVANYMAHEDMAALKLAEQQRRANLMLQHRAMEMAAFETLTARQKARIYTFHGMRWLALGEAGKGRRWFQQSITVAPAYVKAYPLFGVSLISRRGLLTIAHLRRRLRKLLRRTMR